MRPLWRLARVGVASESTLVSRRSSPAVTMAARRGYVLPNGRSRMRAQLGTRRRVRGGDRRGRRWDSLRPLRPSCSPARDVRPSPAVRPKDRGRRMGALARQDRWPWRTPASPCLEVKIAHSACGRRPGLVGRASGYAERRWLGAGRPARPIRRDTPDSPGRLLTKQKRIERG